MLLHIPVLVYHASIRFLCGAIWIAAAWPLLAEQLSLISGFIHVVPPSLERMT
jgi:hypothetical protein